MMKKLQVSSKVISDVVDIQLIRRYLVSQRLYKDFDELNYMSVVYTLKPEADMLKLIADIKAEFPYKDYDYLVLPV